MFYHLLYAATVNDNLLTTFQSAPAVQQVLKTTIYNATVVTFGVNSSKSYFTSYKDQCKESCELVVTTQIVMNRSRSYKCRANFQFTISLDKDTITQHDTLSNCVLVDETTLPMSVKYVEKDVKTCSEISSFDMTAEHDPTAIGNHLGFYLRFNTYFWRFKFDKAFELPNGGSLTAFAFANNLLYEFKEDDSVELLKPNVTVGLLFESTTLLVMKFVPTILSSSLLYVVTENLPNGYINFRLFYFKTSMHPEKRKVFTQKVVCKRAIMCFAKLSLRFRKLESIAEME